MIYLGIWNRRCVKYYFKMKRNGYVPKPTNNIFCRSYQSMALIIVINHNRPFSKDYARVFKCRLKLPRVR